MAKKPAAKPAPAPQPGGDLNDLLGALNEQVVETAKGPAEKARPLVEATEDLMIEFAGVDAALKTCESRKAILGGELKASIWEALTDIWFQSKVKPNNPKVETKKANKVDCSAIYQCRATFKVICREDHPSAKGAVTEALEAVGFDAATATRIFDENVEIVIETGLRPFNELAVGKWSAGDGGKEFQPATDVQKGAAKKLLQFVVGGAVEPLSPQERAECLIKSTRYEVKAGFLDRAANYCESVEELRALLTVIKPGEALSGIKFAAADTAQDRARRVEEIFHNLLFGQDGRAIAAVA